MPIHSLPQNAATGYVYRGVNVLTLWAAAAARGYPLPRRLAFRQARELGGFVRKGEKATAIVLLKRITVTGERRGRKAIGAGRSASCAPSRPSTSPRPTGCRSGSMRRKPPSRKRERHAAAEAFLGGLGAEVRHGGDRACYCNDRDG